MMDRVAHIINPVDVEGSTCHMRIPGLPESEEEEVMVIPEVPLELDESEPEQL